MIRCFDDAKICELVVVYMLYLLRTVLRKENVGLYRKDELSIIPKSSGSENERKRKQIIYIFKGGNLKSLLKQT